MPARLETYVEELRHELRDLSVTSRAQELAEVRTHLEELKAANVELGLTDEEAEAAAITQFGGSRTIGKSVKKAYWRDQWDSIPGVICIYLILSELGFSVFFWRSYSYRGLSLSPVLAHIILGAMLQLYSGKKAVKGLAILTGIYLLREIAIIFTHGRQPGNLVILQLIVSFALLGSMLATTIRFPRMRGVA